MLAAYDFCLPSEPMYPSVGWSRRGRDARAFKLLLLTPSCVCDWAETWQVWVSWERPVVNARLGQSGIQELEEPEADVLRR